MLNQCILVGRIKELHEGNNESVNEYCKKGDIVGVKGRLENVNDVLIVKAEKITFLSSRTQDDIENEDDTDEEEEQID